MKKLLLSCVVLLSSISVFAQGSWQRTMNKADELKGQEAGEVLIYTVPQMGSFVCWGWDKYQFRLTSDEAQFNSQYVGRDVGVNIMVGFYDDNDKLIEKFKMWLDREDNVGNRFVRTRNAGTMSNPVGQKGKVKKIFSALQSGKGYVRIVTERYNTTDFDLKITPFKE